MPEFRFPSTPRERQTLVLTPAKLESLREWATEGTGVTAAALVTDSSNRIALVENTWSDGWILPGGGVEAGERPADAAKREVREETGLDASIHEPVVVVDQTYTSAENGEPWFSALYVAYAASADGDIPDADELGVSEGEITAARWFDSLPETLHDDDLLRPYLVEHLG